MAQEHPSTSVRRFHPGARDLWVAHLRRTTSWVAVGSVGLAAALVGLAAYETPSHHTTGTAGATTSPGSAPATGSAGAPGVTAPAGTPAAAGSGAAGSGATTGSAGATPGTVTRAPATSGSVVSPGAGSAHVSTGLS